MDNEQASTNIAAAVAAVETGFLSVSQAAKSKGVTVDAVYKAIERGHLNKQVVLGKTVLSSADVEAWAPGGYTTTEGKREGAKKTRGTAGGRPPGRKTEGSGTE